MHATQTPYYDAAEQHMREMLERACRAINAVFRDDLYARKNPALLGIVANIGAAEFARLKSPDPVSATSPRTGLTQ